MRATPIFLSILGVLIVSSACRLDRPEPLPTGPTHLVTLNLERERVEQTDSPLTPTRATATDIYAVQVYRKNTTSSGSYSIKYAYGIFDDPSKMILELEEGKLYKIEVTAVEQATEVLATSGNGGYGAPFELGGTGAGTGKVTNAFTKTMAAGMKSLTTGLATIREGNTLVSYDRPPVSRFYGTVEGISPEEEMSLTVPLKWVCFALTAQPESFTEGKIVIRMEGAPELVITPDEPESVTRRIFTFQHPDGAGDWTEEEYRESVPTTIVWIDAGGTEHLLRQEHPFVFTRKYEKILRIVCGETPQDRLLLNKEPQVLTPEVPEIIEKE